MRVVYLGTNKLWRISTRANFINSTADQIIDFQDPEQDIIDSGTNIVPITKGVDSTITPWFSRPQLIQTLPWIEGGSINTSISPLALLFDPTITSNWDKIKGYSKIRGNLHLKLELNASPFHFGAINVSWAPLTTEYGNDSTTNPESVVNYDCLRSFSGGSLSAYTTMTKSDDSALMRVTQRLNGFLYPQDCNSLDFNIPFLYPKEFIELRSLPYVNNSYSANSMELYQFGSLVFVTAVPLKVAQTLTGGIATINVFAWMSDVELEGPSFVLTSGVVAAAGSAMTSFKDVPIIGGYLAKAGAISKASAKVMSLLGMSNEPDERQATVVQANVLPALTAVDINSTSRYLGLAPHSGLSMAPTESWSDELEIDQFGKCKTCVGVADWTISDSKGTSIFKANVTPEIHNLVSLNTNTVGQTVDAITQTPAGYVSSLFGMWRGKLKYHFTAVASQYHRGRLRMHYDSTLGGTFKEGFVFSKVWDITETKNFEFEVPFTASTQMLLLGHWQYTTLNTGYNYKLNGKSTAMINLDPRFHNGFVNMTVLNQLLGPNAVGVYIMCFISVEGLEFAQPVQPGTSVAYGSKPGSEDQVKYITLTQDYYTTSSIPSDHKPFDAEIYNGEKIQSLRVLLHRSSDYGFVSPGVVAAGGTGQIGGVLSAKLTIPREPISPGEHTYGGLAVDKVKDNAVFGITPPSFLNNSGATSGSQYGYNYVPLTPFTFLKGMFVGYRGSFRWKFVPDVPATMSPGYAVSGSLTAPNEPVLLSLVASRSRKYPGSQTWNTMTANGATLSSQQYSALTSNRASQTIRGSELNTSVFGNSVSIDVPQYSLAKFLSTNEAIRSFDKTSVPTAKLGVVASIDQLYGMANDSIDLDMRFYNPAAWGGSAKTDIKSPTLKAYVSCGTDFSFVGFLNAPVLFCRNSLPNPATT